MINIDDRILSNVNESELFLLLHIVKRMKDSRMTAWPSLERLSQDCNWDERTVKRWRKSLIQKGILSMKQESGKPSVYRLKGTGISVFNKVDDVEMQEKEGAENGGTKNVGGTKNEGTKNAVEGVQKMYPEVINKEVINKRVTDFASLAPNSLTHPPVSDVYTPIEEEEKRMIAPAAAAPPEPGLYSSPKAKTPEALFDAVVEFYKNNPEMWHAGILEMGKGQRYSKEKQVEIVRDWCCYMIQKNQGGNTYVQLNASLQSWFRNEQFATWKNKPVQAPAGSAAPTDAVYTPPPPNTITPAFVK